MHRILIVDDISFFRETLKKTLCERFPSIIVEEAVDGNDVLEKIKKFNPSLIFMDIKLPGENGIKLTAKIKAIHPELTIIILTNYDLPEYREAAFENGADGYIAKGSLKMSEIETLLKKQCINTPGQ